MNQLLNAQEVATMLQISKWQVYELVKEQTRSGDERRNPLPCIKIGTSVRFIKAEVEKWVANLATSSHY